MSRRRWWMWLTMPHLCIENVWLLWLARRAIRRHKKMLADADARAKGGGT